MCQVVPKTVIRMSFFQNRWLLDIWWLAWWSPWVCSSFCAWSTERQSFRFLPAVPWPSRVLFLDLASTWRKIRGWLGRTSGQSAELRNSVPYVTISHTLSRHFGDLWTIFWFPAHKVCQYRCRGSWCPSWTTIALCRGANQCQLPHPAHS